MRIQSTNMKPMKQVRMKREEQQSVEADETLRI